MAKIICSVLAVILLGVSLLTGCGGKEVMEVMEVMADDGDTVKVHYIGTLEDSTVFDTSRMGEPLEFTLGQGQVLPGFEEAVKGMRAGQVQTVAIPSEEAYGPHDDDLVAIVMRAQFLEDLELEIGQQWEMQGEEGKVTDVVITDISETSITVDANHPLAGEDLTFEIELIEIK